jgi:hypothetical protein
MSEHPGASDDEWGDYQKMVLNELERHNAMLQHMDEKIDQLRHEDFVNLRVEIATLKVKASLWGGAAGLGALLVALALKLIAGV